MIASGISGIDARNDLKSPGTKRVLGGRVRSGNNAG